MEGYTGKQYVGIDLHRRRTVIVRMDESGHRLGMARIENGALELGLEVAKAGPNAEVVLEACYGWYWAADVLAEQVGPENVHLAHPLGVKGFTYRRVKNDERDASDLADLLRMNRLPEAWIASPEVRDLREAVRHRAKLVCLILPVLRDQAGPIVDLHPPSRRHLRSRDSPAGCNQTAYLRERAPETERGATTQPPKRGARP